MRQPIGPWRWRRSTDVVHARPTRSRAVVRYPQARRGLPPAASSVAGQQRAAKRPHRAMSARKSSAIQSAKYKRLPFQCQGLMPSQIRRRRFGNPLAAPSFGFLGQRIFVAPADRRISSPQSPNPRRSKSPRAGHGFFAAHLLAIRRSCMCRNRVPSCEMANGQPSM